MISKEQARAARSGEGCSGLTSDWLGLSVAWWAVVIQAGVGLAGAVGKGWGGKVVARLVGSVGTGRCWLVRAGWGRWGRGRSERIVAKCRDAWVGGG